jgi:hypothetical protein
MTVIVTVHAAERYRERINPRLTLDEARAANQRYRARKAALA